MPKLHFRSLLDAPMEAVWAFHGDPETGLTALSPPEADMKVTRADAPAVGAEVVIRVKTPIGRRRIVTVFREWQPPHGSRPHRTAWFIDEATQSPFRKWVHRHRFEEVVDEGRTKVWAIDDVDYALPLGPIGLVADRLFVRRKLKSVFAFRHERLRERLCRR